MLYGVKHYSFSEACKEIVPRGKNGKKTSTSTLWRWHRKGISGVRLETVLIGGRRYVTRPGLEQFCIAVTETRDGQLGRNDEPAGPVVAGRDIDAELDAAGL